MVALTVLVLLGAAVLLLVTAGVLVGPERPRSGPEAWIARDDARMEGGR
jgi:hypothetical protein